jgi:hypothetical protein
MISEKLFRRLIRDSYEIIELPNGSRAKHFSYIIFRKKTVIAFGVNSAYKTHPLAHKYGYKFSSIHSELAAILNFPFPPARLRECKLVNVRLGLDGKVKLSKPCKCCQRLIAAMNFDEVWYTTNNEGFVKL